MSQEKNNPTISIVIPVYNAQDTLEECVDSVLAQTFTDFELLLVDDGSPDESGAICDRYEKKDPRVRVFHTENGGSSAARNYGIDRATGSYLGFIDSDDRIESDMYELLYNNLKKENAEISMCGIADVYSGEIVNPISKPMYRVMDVEETIRIIFEAEVMTVSPVNKLYDRKLFTDVRYPVGEDFGEDASIIVDLLLQCRTCVMTTEQKYYYIHRGESITTREYRPTDRSVIRAYQKNYKLIKKHMPSLLPEAQMRLCWAYFFVLDKLLISSNRKEFKDDEKELVGFLRRHMRFILRDPRFNKTRKIAMVLLRVHTGLYRRCVIWQRNHKRLA